MIPKLNFSIALIFLFIINPFSDVFSQEEITKQELKDHIQFLAHDSLKGRFPGTAQNKIVVDYIKSDFIANGITSEFQEFKAKLKVDSSEVKTWNVIGFIEGNDSKLKNEIIVLGAHYDHLGENEGSIFNGADDNASGTAALLEIAEKVKANHGLLKRSILFIAFGAEEQGLLGSSYFVNHPTVSLNDIKLMINMDMVGHLNAENHVYMGGAGTFPGGMQLMDSLGMPNHVKPVVHAGSIAGSDHVSFYKKGISVLGIHTGGHDNYHKPTDVIVNLNLAGEVKVANYIYNALMAIATSTREMKFIAQD
ncbi:M28 family metallopeptidase [Zunongwangia sp. HGR-M22]|uniref:M28 family metallopeptidase n=1 Tax=Zunongwangia sp. HGR-M22 TaxID=3015168 RepID=UPI0022DE5442|nr:M20/M25/M40 family metallo-hydrolase [Zunongwangia sp. HGR-M22]WBL27163.1 M20/M25/M40 family metallo-hydrolase [Zunongwangia sp. HGR-M22]